mgnify:CR=1 FL=1
MVGAKEGSSPLARGLLQARDAKWSSALDHPRSRGVYPDGVIVDREHYGSSPLARGLRNRLGSGLFAHRIIPARAGFTQCDSIPHPRGGDHPRSRGVYLEMSTPSNGPAGSSPLARGLRDIIAYGSDGAGIIPARAGFTRRTHCPWASDRDHPRSRGVYVMKNAIEKGEEGSSPLARGLHLTVQPHRDRIGIIPARAGFTNFGATVNSWLGDHPRSRGVYWPPTNGNWSRRGSSPLARGLPGVHGASGFCDGIIPARAGFTNREEQEDEH